MTKKNSSLSARISQLRTAKKTNIVALLVVIAIIATIMQIYLGVRMSLQVITSGLLVGGLYGLAAAGLSLIFGVTKIINICQGEIIILGAYVAFWLNFFLGIDPFLSIVVTIPLFFIIGAAIQKFLLGYAMSRALAGGASGRALIVPQFLTAWAIGLAVQNLMMMAWTADTRGIVTSYSGLSTTVGGVIISHVRLAAFVAAMISLVALNAFLSRTLLGKAIRATSQDWEAATLVGVNTRRINLISYSIGMAFAGVAGSFISATFGFSPTSGAPFFMKAMCIIVLGGVGSVPGTLFGGLILGTIESVSSFIVGAWFRDVIAYAIFLLVIIFKPSGLFVKG